MYYIHYPSGGFGHYMFQMLCICYDNVYCPEEKSTFSENGNSHDYPLHYKVWKKNSPFFPEPNFDFNQKESICLIDSGINDDNYRNTANTIRLVIDKNARSIIFQTNRIKAERSTFTFDLEDWEIREQYSLVYHHADLNENFYLRNFQPHKDCINVPISSIIFSISNVANTLKKYFGSYSKQKLEKLHKEFLYTNEQYILAAKTAKQLEYCLKTDTDMSLDHITELHDQGYLNYIIEKYYKIKEIPPYDYRDWFKNTKEIRSCLKSII